MAADSVFESDVYVSTILNLIIHPKPKQKHLFDFFLVLLASAQIKTDIQKQLELSDYLPEPQKSNNESHFLLGAEYLNE